MFKQPQLELQAVGDAVGKRFQVFILHPLGKFDQPADMFFHFGNFFVASAATLAVGAFFGALAVARFELHIHLPLGSKNRFYALPAGGFRDLDQQGGARFAFAIDQQRLW